MRINRQMLLFPGASLQTGVYHLAVFYCISKKIVKPVKDWKIISTSPATLRLALVSARHEMKMLFIIFSAYLNRWLKPNGNEAR